MSIIKFGTSGFRGILADNFTKENVQKVAYSVAKKYHQLTKKTQQRQPIPVGYDNRFMGQDIAKWFAEVLAYENIPVLFFERPTPSTLVSFETKNRVFGVHITASHNPYFYNGIKTFMQGGRETPEELNNFFEKVANKAKKVGVIDFDEAVEQGRIELTNDIEAYCKSILSFVDCESIRKSKLKVLFNSMHGSSSEVMRHIFKQVGLKTAEIMNEEIDPYFEHKVCAPYPHNLVGQTKIMKKGGYDLGLAVDGDGDRFTALDNDGTPYDCNEISALFMDNFLKKGRKKRAVVKNCALSGLLEKVAKKGKAEVFNAKVGFKNTAMKMLEQNAILGVESNGMCIKDHTLHKDGIVCSLIMIDIMSKEKQTIKAMIDQLKDRVGYPCAVLEFAYPISEKKKAEINDQVFIRKELPVLSAEIVATSYDDGLKMFFKNDYWAVIRFSGNENVVRLFAEMPDKKQTEKIIKELEDFIDTHTRQK